MLCLFGRNEDGTYTCVNCGGTKGQYEQCPSDTEGNPIEPLVQESVPRQHEAPSFFQMAKNAGTSMVNHAMNSFQSVPANVKEERISICEGCEHYDSETTRCDECGCFINIKADWASEKCPIDKWGMWTGGQGGGGMPGGGGGGEMPGGGGGGMPGGGGGGCGGCGKK